MLMGTTDIGNMFSELRINNLLQQRDFVSSVCGIVNSRDLQPTPKDLNYAHISRRIHKAYHEKALAVIENDNIKSSPSIYFTCLTYGKSYETKAPKRCGIFMTTDSMIAINS